MDVVNANDKDLASDLKTSTNSVSIIPEIHSTVGYINCYKQSSVVTEAPDGYANSQIRLIIGVPILRRSGMS
jgi:hypothetical protein